MIGIHWLSALRRTFLQGFIGYAEKFDWYRRFRGSLKKADLIGHFTKSHCPGAWWQWWKATCLDIFKICDFWLGIALVPQMQPSQCTAKVHSKTVASARPAIAILKSGLVWESIAHIDSVKKVQHYRFDHQRDASSSKQEQAIFDQQLSHYLVIPNTQAWIPAPWLMWNCFKSLKRSKLSLWTREKLEMELTALLRELATPLAASESNTFVRTRNALPLSPAIILSGQITILSEWEVK